MCIYSFLLTNQVEFKSESEYYVFTFNIESFKFDNESSFQIFKLGVYRCNLARKVMCLSNYLVYYFESLCTNIDD